MTATLEWALGPDGQPRSASWFVGIDPRDRPRMTCPCAASDGTRHEVLAKAGESGKVTPHFAHLPDSTCAATNPETAEHYNAKMRLASILGDADGLYISARCKAGHRVACLWSARSWLSAVPEFSVGTRRPDVVLLGRDREVIGAIEVLHSHAVDARKARDLATWGVRWIEVRSLDGADKLTFGGNRQTHQRAVEGGTLYQIGQLLRRLGVQRQFDLRTDGAEPWKEVNKPARGCRFHRPQAQAPGGVCRVQRLFRLFAKAEYS